MHLMTRSSEEGMLPGLGWVAANTVRFNQVADPNLRVPHMGWNKVRAVKEISLIANMEDETRFYFAHSFFVKPDHASDVLLEAHYGTSRFAAAVVHDNIVAVQFHPEKSHKFGMWFLKNFAESSWCSGRV
jgi:glutamine amidotransferase